MKTLFQITLFISFMGLIRPMGLMAQTKDSALPVASSVAGTDRVRMLMTPGGTPSSGTASMATLATYLQSATQTFTNKSFDTAGTGNTLKINGTTVSAVTGSGAVVLGTSPDFTTGATIGGVAIPTISSTNTLTNKTYDTAGTGNVFKINGTAISDITGTGKVALDTSATLTTPTINQANLVGTTTNDNAASGSVGQLVQSLVASGSAVSLTSTIAANVTSISLTAGDWDVEGAVQFVAGSATVTTRKASIFTTSATQASDGSEGNNGSKLTTTSSTDGITLPRKRLSLAATTTVYLVADSTFSAGTVSAYGVITARRVR